MNSETNDYSISVVIPAYNAGKHIARAIDSVLAQTQPPCEIIVVDDGSTDDTAQVVARYRPKVTYIYQDNAGASVARNTGIQAAAGQWIAFLDADDEWLADKLKLQIEHLKRNPDLVWTTGNYIHCVCTTEQKSPHFTPEKAKAILSGTECFESFFQAFLQNAWGCTDTMLIRRDILMESGLFVPGRQRGEDIGMWWRIAYRKPKIGVIARPLAIYHLDIEGSLIRKPTDTTALCEFFADHLKLAEQHGKSDDLRPCAAYLLRRWMRSMLFDEQAGEIRLMLKQFGDLLPAGYKAFMRILTAFPKTTAAGCRMTSRIVQTLNLRKRLVRTRQATEKRS